jgi:hypothetical protein
MNASTHFFTAFPQSDEQPAVTFVADPVVRVSAPVTPTWEMSDVAWTSVSPFTGEVICTVQLDEPTPPG